MKILILSDLHLEKDDNFSLDVNILNQVDLCIFAGDIHKNIEKSLDWIYEQIKNINIKSIYVPGNHEFYKNFLIDEINNAQQLKNKYKNIFLLNDDYIIINNIKFIGSILWTDYNLHNNQKEAMDSVRKKRFNKYSYAIYSKKHNRIIDPNDLLFLHKKSVSYIEKELNNNNIKSIIISHYLPTQKSIKEIYGIDDLNPSFASNLEHIIKQYQPQIWIHGHTHSNFDYILDKTRIICNPRGYIKNNIAENNEFDINKIIEL